MTTLSANIDDAQTLISISGPLTNGTFALPLYYTIDSEAIRVTGRAHRTTWLVDRGIAGTTAASHSSGATLTRYYPDAASNGGAGGLTFDNTVDPPEEVTSVVAPGAVISSGSADLSALQNEQRISLLGPFDVAFDTSGIDAGVEAFDLPLGSSVIRSWIVNTAFWDGTGPQLQLLAKKGASAQSLGVYAPDLGGPYGISAFSIEDFMGTDGATPTHTRVATALETDVGIYVKLVWNGGAPGQPTQGAGSAYALIAEPV